MVMSTVVVQERCLASGRMEDMGEWVTGIAMCLERWNDENGINLY
jgi:hypothetical protein